MATAAGRRVRAGEAWARRVVEEWARKVVGGEEGARVPIPMDEYERDMDDLGWAVIGLVARKIVESGLDSLDGEEWYTFWFAVTRTETVPGEVRRAVEELMRAHG